MASSKPFRFTIGPQKREFTMPSALVAAQSPAFQRLVNNRSFKEAQDQHSQLEHVDEKIFIRFIEFTYTGKYANINEDLRMAKIYGSTPMTPLKMSRQSRERFRPRMPCSSHWGRSLQKNSVLDHARVFVFADYWGVTRLAGLSLRLLGEELKVAAPERPMAREHIIDLVEYCFADARPPMLVILVTQYAAFKLPDLWMSGEFQDILRNSSDLSLGLVSSIVQARFSN
ncbi:hypothetical protein B0T14DRAFT_580174 [Immersiella caudata]|uniref:BTB domain-containing protein n=1 Tax=Immersiella caudata TaxID=314043 RepID=A0AA40C703_9PEZI|nr:hypothetical protein B0T14DRAFT_580174 [Immersiella caudata]